ncbi:uncharacterized protein BXZ73DRAFT_105382 [Epithele typhae]|uniref:uncharacterized protein n=1 Tax=Epithele typhae TaxID=378194 RepID=UPI0020085104|nr:uncharacterized protein BXZ73DRAFT_106951 [Epithele typhae]XP_047873697.1 uncharacterized protein BXZ73DRAFT_105382 [Epithele typhae]KAH9913477.1 hypothetical protein BXZ73DRAFT_106951 [Epithele typhae]KAH9917860.1 hypothetical protein BXZ73DRAFT_105382 [Epithele typhae]
METLPLELLQRIFFFATIDGGATSCSLALVSKHIHSVSQYHRLDNVALMGRPKYMMALTRRLEAEKERNATSRGRLRHLFLSCTQSQYLQLVEKSKRSFSRHEGPVYLPEGYAPLNGANDSTIDSGSLHAHTSAFRYAKFINDLLHAAASGLETLAIIFLERDLTQYIRLPSTLPTLRELTVSGAPPSWLLDLAEPRPPHQPPRFPALRRLHWYDRRGPGGTLDDIPAVAERLPALTHFRITGYMGDSMPGVFDACADEDMLERVEDSVEPWDHRTHPKGWYGLPDFTIESTLDPPKVPLLPQWRGLRQFVIQPSFVSFIDDFEYDKEGVFELRLMWMSLASASLPVYVFAPISWMYSGSGQAESVDMLHLYHEERIRGDLGCWADGEKGRRAMQNDYPQYLH